MNCILEWTKLSAARRHVYVYTVLLLITLLVSTIKQSQSSSAALAGQNQLSSEVGRMIQIGAIARDLY